MFHFHPENHIFSSSALCLSGEGDCLCTASPGLSCWLASCTSMVLRVGSLYQPHHHHVRSSATGFDWWQALAGDLHTYRESSRFLFSVLVCLFGLHFLPEAACLHNYSSYLLLLHSYISLLPYSSSPHLELKCANVVLPLLGSRPEHPL